MRIMPDDVDYQPESVAEEIAADLRMCILHGTIKAGTKLKEIELCKQYNSSRTPVREAFRILQHENLISSSRFVGATAIALTHKFLEDSSELRCLLECQAVELAVRNASEEDLKTLGSLKEKMQSIGSEDIGEFIITNKRFHLMLGHMSGNRELEKAIIQAWYSTRSFRILSMEQHMPGRVSLASLEHIKVIQAVMDRNAKEGVRYLKEHFDLSLARNKRCIDNMASTPLGAMEVADAYEGTGNSEEKAVLGS